MMNLSVLFDELGTVAEKVLPVVATSAPEAIDLAQSVIRLVETMRADLPTTAEQRQQLSAYRDQVEKSVNARVDKTTAALRG